MNCPPESRAEALAELCDRLRVGILYAFGSQAGAVREWLTGNRSGLAAGPGDGRPVGRDAGRPGPSHLYHEIEPDEL